MQWDCELLNDTTVDQWSEKWQSKHNYICKYNNLPTTCFGRDWPSSGWDTMSEEMWIYCKYRYGGTRSRLQTHGACGRIGVGTSMCPFGMFICWVVGSRGWVLKHWWPGVTMVGWCGCCMCTAVEGGILSHVGKSGERLASMLNVGWFNEKTYVEKALWSNWVSKGYNIYVRVRLVRCIQLLTEL